MQKRDYMRNPNIKNSTRRLVGMLQRVWVDALTPKQLLFFSKLVEKLERKGLQVLFTTRAYREVLGLREIKGIECIVVGKHGGRDLESKLIASIERMRELISLVKEWKPDITISHSSPEASRVSFGLRIPHLCANDSPHSIYVAKLTIPLSQYLFTPWIIPKRIWTRFGIDSSRIIHYKGLDPVAWLKEFSFSPRVLKELGISGKRDIIVIRETESFASYLLDAVKTLAPITDSILPPLLKQFQDNIDIVILPRYDEQVLYLKEKKLPDNVIIADKVIDATSLLYYSTLLIGGGGTMNIEAALLGKPVISVYPGKTTMIEQYLIKKKVIFRPRSVKEVIAFSQKILQEKKLREGIRSRGLKLFRSMENPVNAILKEIMQRF